MIYGHQSGVRIIWRGGRAFKREKFSPEASKKSNGAEAVISLDSDDEIQDPQDVDDQAEFEDDEDENDSTNPYPIEVQHLDLYLGIDVLHVSVLPSHAYSEEQAQNPAELIAKNIVFAVACADHTVRLMTVPLVPPSPKSKSRELFNRDHTAAFAGKGNWHETVILLNGHHKSSRGIAMTMHKTATDDLEIVVASHSMEAGGSLLLWRYPLATPQSFLESVQRMCLVSPAVSLSFNPSTETGKTSQLLLADSAGACRVYDFTPATTTSTDDGDVPVTEIGTWCVALYVGFDRAQDSGCLGSHNGFGRKTIVDAKWVCSGKAIMVLLHDGGWGIWDVDGIAPNAVRGMFGRSGIKGGSFSDFNLEGLIDTNGRAGASTLQKSTAKFQPITPSTRKTIDVFTSRPQQQPSGPVSGMISVVEIPSTSSTTLPDESVLLWLENTYASIPNLGKYWQANVRKAAGGSNDLFSNDNTGRMVRLDKIDLLGERCSGICHLPSVQLSNNTALPCDLLVLGEHRLIVVSPIRKSQRPRGNARNQVVVPVISPRISTDLDVMEIDSALDHMENGARKGKRLNVA